MFPIFSALLSGQVSTVVDASEGSSAGGIIRGLLSSPVAIIVIYAIFIFVVIYFLSSKPQQKKEKERKAMLDSLKPGDSVILTSGFFGTISDVTADCFIVEFGTNKTVRIPIYKDQILGKKEPNLSNKPVEEVKEEKKSLFKRIFGKKDNKEENSI